MINIGYLGPKGTYCEQATDVFVERLGLKVKKVTLPPGIPGMFLELDSGKVQAIVVPLINSIYGPYVETVKGLGRFPLVQKGSLDLKIDLAIGIHPESCLEDITEVRSRDTALGECAQYLDKNFSSTRRVKIGSTAQGMKEIHDNKLMHVAAVGGEYGLQLYGLKVIARNIEDRRDNFTTFLYLCKKE